MPKKRSDRPDVDSLLPDVDQEMQGGSAPETEQTQSGEEKTTYRQDDKSTNRQDDKTARRQREGSVLSQQLEVLMDGPDSAFADELPDLDARANGYLSKEVEEALQQATSVLKNKYSGVSKSLLMNYAIRLAMWDLRENADESSLVQWLDRINDGSGKD